MAYELSSSVGSHTETTIAAVTTAVSYRGGFLSDDANILAVPTVYGNQGQAGQGTHPSVAPGIDFYTYSGGSWSFDQHMALTASSLTTGDEQRAVQQAHWVSDDEFLLTDYSKKFFRIKKVSGTWTPTHEFRPADQLSAASSYHILAAGLNPSKDVFAVGQRYAFFYRKSGDTWAYEDAVGSTSGLASGLGVTSLAWSSDTAVIVGSPYDDSTREGLVRTIKYDGSGGWDKQSGANGDWQASTDNSMFGQNIFVHTQATGSGGDAYLWISRYGVGTGNRPELLSAEITNTTNGAFSSAGFVYPSDNSGNNIAVRGRDKYDTTSITTSYSSTELQYTPVHLESEQTSRLENANRNMFRIDRGSHGSGSSRQVWFGRRPSFHNDFVAEARTGQDKTSTLPFLVANEWSEGADGWVQTILATGSATANTSAKQAHYSPWDYSNGRAVFANYPDGGSSDTGLTPSGVKILDFGSSTREASADSTSPSISSTTLSSTDVQNNTLGIGDTVKLTVAYDEAVVVVTSGGTPSVTFDVGGNTRTASYASGTGTTSIVFEYDITASDTADSNGISVNANISLNGGTMKDAAGNNAATSFTALSNNASFLVDPARPTISSLSVADDNSTVTVTFAENVYANANGTGDLVAADFAITGSGGNMASLAINATPSAISKTSQSVWVLTLNGTNLGSNAAGTETLTVDAANDTSIFDLAGNAHTAAASSTTLNSTTAIADSVNASLGSTAGTIKAGFNNTAPRAQLNVPAGALDSDITLTVDTSPSSMTKEQALKLIQDAGTEGDIISDIVSLEPHGQVFNSAVTLIIDITGSLAGTTPSRLQVWKRNGDSAGDAWYRMPSNLWQSSTGSIEISTTSFSQYMAVEGTCMKRTRLNDNQLEKIVSFNKVAPAAIAMTGSATAKGSVVAGDLFVVQGTSGTSQPVSASVMKDFFFGGGSGLDLADADITNVGVINADTLTTDASATGLHIDGQPANTGTFKISFGDNLANALDIAQSGSSYLKFVSTDGSEQIVFGKNATFSGVTIADLGTVTTANIDGGSIDGTTIGAASQAAIQATTLSASSTLNVAGATNLGVDNQFAVSSAGALTTSGAISGSGQVTFEGAARFGAGQQTTISAAGVVSSSAAHTLEGVMSFGAGAQTTISAAGVVSSSAAHTLEGVMSFGAGAQSTISAAGLLSSSATATLHNASFDRLTVGSSVNIDGGAIDGTTVGATTQAAGKFTTLSASSTLDIYGVAKFGTGQETQISAAGLLSSSATATLHNATLDQLTVGTSANVGALTVTGDLTVTGVTTYVDSTHLMVEDSLIEIARGSGTAGTRASNAGAGLFISGSTTGKDISLVAASDGGRLKVSGSADVGSGFDIISGGDYAINGTSVLTATTLGSAVVNSSLTSLGTQGEALDMGDNAIQNVGDIDADSVSIADASAGLKIDATGANNATFEIIMEDDDADALSVKDSGGQDYLVFTTTNSAPLITFSANPTFAGRTIADLGSVTTADINGGTIDNTTIGATTQAAVQATTLSASSTLNVAGATNLGVDNQFAVSAAGALTTSGTISGSGQVTLEGATRFGAGQQTTISAAGVVSSSAAHTLEGVMSFGAGAQSTISAAGLLSSSATATLHNASFDRLTVGSSVNIDGGAIDGTTVGASTQAAGKFTTLSASSTLDIYGVAKFGTGQETQISAAGVISSSATATLYNATLDRITVDGGSIDGTTIGGSTAAAGTFTTLDCNDGAFAVANLDIDGASDIGADLAATDLIMVDDGANGTNRKSAVSRIGDFLVGADQGLHVVSGQLQIIPVEQVFYSGNVGNNTGAAGRMTANLLTASLNTASLGEALGGATGSMMVFLNGMLQTLSGSQDAPGSSVATDRCIYDYRVDKDNVGYIYLNDALDEDDVLVVKYLKK